MADVSSGIGRDEILIRDAKLLKETVHEAGQSTRGWTVSDIGGTLRVVPGLPVPTPPPSGQ